MTYHVRVGKVNYDNIILIRLDCCNELVTYFICTHLWLQIISSNLRRFYKNSIFSFIWFLYAAIEEECYVSILLCLSDTCLFLAVLCKELTKCISDFFFHKCDLFIFDCSIVFCKAYKCCLDSVSSVKSVKAVVTECSCELSCSVRTEVEEYYGIIFFDRCNRCAVLCYYKWYNELIRYICIIRSLDSLCSRSSCLAFAC